MTSFVEASPTATRKSGEIKLHGPADFAGMRKAGSLAAEALDLLVELVKPGVTTAALDDLVLDFALAHKAYPAPLDYRGYRKSICTSINHVVCHGIPDDKPLRRRRHRQYRRDPDPRRLARRFRAACIWSARCRARPQRLVEVTYEAMMRGIAAVRPGATTGDIGQAIQDYAEGERCSVVRDFCGHGLGRLFHDAAQYPALSAAAAKASVLKPGMFFTIEPMINLGRPHVKSVRRLDRGHARPLAVGAIRAFGRRHRNRRRNLHPVAARPSPAALRALMAGAMHATGGAARRCRAAPHYLGHRDRLRERFLAGRRRRAARLRAAGARAVPRACRAATSSRSPRP